MLCRNEALAGLSNVGAYTALALPVFLGPDAYIGDILTIMMSTAGVALAAVTSAVPNVVAIVSGLLAGVLGVWELIAGMGGEIVSEALGVVQEGVQGALEAAEEEPVLAATAKGVAYGATRSALESGKKADESQTLDDKRELETLPRQQGGFFGLLKLLGLRFIDSAGSGETSQKVDAAHRILDLERPMVTIPKTEEAEGNAGEAAHPGGGALGEIEIALHLSEVVRACWCQVIAIALALATIVIVILIVICLRLSGGERRGFGLR